MPAKRYYGDRQIRKIWYMLAAGVEPEVPEVLVSELERAARQYMTLADMGGRHRIAAPERFYELEKRAQLMSEVRSILRNLCSDARSRLDAAFIQLAEDCCVPAADIRSVSNPAPQYIEDASGEMVMQRGWFDDRVRVFECAAGRKKDAIESLKWLNDAVGMAAV